jgi:hypothetical protein
VTKPQKKKPLAVRFQASRFVRDLGGPKALAEMAEKAGVSGVTYAAAAKWLERNAMPLNAVCAILHMDQGRALTPYIEVSR